MLNKEYNSLGIYDKCNNLITYVEYDSENQYVNYYYNVKGNVLERIYHNVYNDGESNEKVKSIIEYENNIMLFSLTSLGETYMIPILSGHSFTSIKSPNIINSIYYCEQVDSEDSFIDNFSLSNNLISDYLNKV